MVSADAEDRVSASAQGAADIGKRTNSDYVIKPIRDQVLLNKLGAVLKLDWEFREDKPVAVRHVNTAVKNLCEGMAIADVRELQNLAELGYVTGIEKLIENMDVRPGSEDCTEHLLELVHSYQFATIISMTQKVIDHDRG